MAASAAYNIALKLIGGPQFQQDTKQAARSWQAINDNTKRFQRQGAQARDALRDLREEVSHFGKTFSEVFPQFGGIAGLLGGGGLIVGLTALGRGFANTGLEISNTSARLAVGGKVLQDWRKTAELAGDTAEDVTASFAGLGRNIFAASRGEQSGINAQLVAKKYNIPFGRGREEDTLRGLNRAFNEDPLLKNNPQKAQAVEEAITGTTGLFDLLNRSPAEFDKLRKQASAAPDLTKQQEEDARRAHEAFTGLSQAVGKLGLDLGEFTNKWLVPLETAMTKVINTVNRSPVAKEAVGVGVTALAGAGAIGIMAKLGKFLGVLPKGLAVPLGPIAGLIGAVMEGAELYRRIPRTDNETWLGEAKKDRSAEAPRLLRDALDSLRRSIDDLKDWWSGTGGGGGVAGMGRPRHGDIFGPARPARPLNPADEKQAMDFFMSKGLTKSQAAGVVGTLEQESRLDPKARNATGHAGIAQWDANRQAGLRGSTSLADQLKYIWQEWQGNEAAAFGRIKAAMTPEETAKAMEGYERGGDYGGRHQTRARQIYETVPGAPALEPPPGAGSRVPARLQNLPGSEDKNPPGPQGSLDSHHHFVLDIRGATSGTRGQMVAQNGPATAEVKTSYALAGV